jgi:diaminohydroxyphosphoribosylaminopyrimidine deaminase/5-amino-6-(5-phosphoribosylamino)uracil reductase
MNRGYFARMKRGRPWVRSKLAASLDGRTALADGTSRWITGESARRDVHVWRARAGAILTGIGTVLRDDPAMTARPDWPGGAPRQPLRAIVDAQLRTPPAAQVLTPAQDGAPPARAVIFTTRAAAAAADGAWPERARIEVVPGDGHCDLAHVLERLGALEVNDVWVEAGAGLNGALLDAGLIDELVLYFAPQILGDTARGLFSLPPLASLAERIDLEIDEIRTISRDIRICARPLPRKE